MLTQAPEAVYGRPGVDARLVRLIDTVLRPAGLEQGGPHDILEALVMTDDLDGHSFGKAVFFDSPVGGAVLAAELGEAVHVERSSIPGMGDTAGEVSVSGVHKALGLQEVVEYFGLSRADVVAVVPRLFPVEMRAAQPADAIATFFSDTFERRTGQPLAIVAGDKRLASLVAVGSRSRPHQFIDEKMTPWLTSDDIKKRGAVVLWPATDTRGNPPPEIKAQFPEIVPEVPRAFDRALPGRAPVLRIGWGVVRPQTVTPAPQ